MMYEPLLYIAAIITCMTSPFNPFALDAPPPPPPQNHPVVEAEDTLDFADLPVQRAQPVRTPAAPPQRQNPASAPVAQPTDLKPVYAILEGLAPQDKREILAFLVEDLAALAAQDAAVTKYNSNVEHSDEPGQVLELADMFAASFDANDRPLAPWVSGSLIVCPGWAKYKTTRGHECCFISVKLPGMTESSWAWEVPSMVSDEKAKVDKATNVLKTISLLSLIEGTELYVVNSKNSGAGGGCSAKSITMFRVQGSRLLPVQEIRKVKGMFQNVSHNNRK